MTWLQLLAIIGAFAIGLGLTLGILHWIENHRLKKEIPMPKPKPDPQKLPTPAPPEPPPPPEPPETPEPPERP